MFYGNGAIGQFWNKAQIVEMIEFFEASLDPQASDYLEILEYRLLAVEEMENAGIA